MHLKDFVLAYVEQRSGLLVDSRKHDAARAFAIPRLTISMTSAEMYNCVDALDYALECTMKDEQKIEQLQAQIATMHTAAIADAARIAELEAALQAKNNHTMIWRREIIDPSAAHMGAALVALRNGDPDSAQNYLELWLDAGGISYEKYTSHQVFFDRFFTSLQCDHRDKAACVAAIAEFTKRVEEDAGVAP